MIRRNGAVAVMLFTLMLGCTPSQSAPLPPRKGGSVKLTEDQKKDLQTATLAGGCFWGMQELIRRQPGVVQTRVGYTGGNVANATYGNHEGHAEAVEILFDPRKTSYEDLLLFFFKMHDPTTVNRQGNDVGSSYRSAIFYHDEAQRQVAERVKARVDKSGAWKRPVVTEIVTAKAFWEAEEDHQDYLQKKPNGYTCHYIRNIKF